MHTQIVSRRIKATPDAVYAAFMDPAVLVSWLPPGEMTGKIHAFDGRAGGGYEMSLFYPQTDSSNRGKTSAHEDRVSVRFLELVPGQKIVEAVTFHSEDSALKDVMTITIVFVPEEEGTEVAFQFEDLPPGVRPEDNEQGARQSLDQLARRFDSAL
jgi:uncharacterized protein YndB with AHSA1/START domain